MFDFFMIPILLPLVWFSKKEIRYFPNRKLRQSNLHVLILGQSGRGKSNLLEALLRQRVGRCKCIDLYDEGRAENFTYALPEHSGRMLSIIRHLSKDYILHERKIRGKGVPNQIIMVAGNRLASLGGWIKELPANVEIRSLDATALALQDMQYLLGSTEGTRNALKAIQFDYGNVDIYKVMEILNNADYQVIHPMQKRSILMDIKSLLGSGMFSDKYPKINFKKVINDKKTLTSFSAMLLETDMDRATFFGLILSSAKQWLYDNQGKHRIAIGIREVSHMASKPLSAGYWYPFQLVKWFAKEGRDIGGDLICDAQFRTQVVPEIRSQFTTVICLGAHQKEAEALSDEVMSLPKKIVEAIPKLKIGIGVVIDAQGYHYPVRFSPTLHHHKSRGENILRTLQELHGIQEV